MYAQFYRRFGVDEATHTVMNTPLWFGMFVKIIIVLVMIIIVYYALSDIWRLDGIEITVSVFLSICLSIAYLFHDYVTLLINMFRSTDNERAELGQSGGDVDRDELESLLGKSSPKNVHSSIWKVIKPSYIAFCLFFAKISIVAASIGIYVVVSGRSNANKQSSLSPQVSDSIDTFYRQKKEDDKKLHDTGICLQTK